MLLFALSTLPKLQHEPRHRLPIHSNATTTTTKTKKTNKTKTSSTTTPHLLSHTEQQHHHHNFKNSNTQMTTR